MHHDEGLTILRVAASAKLDNTLNELQAERFGRTWIQRSGQPHEFGSSQLFARRVDARVRMRDRLRFSATGQVFGQPSSRCIP